MELDTTKLIQKTLAIIKPDAIRNGHFHTIRDRIIMEGYTIITEKHLTLSKEFASDFYSEHKDEHFYDDLIQFMTGGKSVVLVLAKLNAISDFRDLIGNEVQEDTLRYLYGTDETQKAVHGSDAVASAKRELKLFFPRISVDPIPTNTDANEYIQEYLQGVLLEGLTELCKKKPEKPVDYLANWLLSRSGPKIVEQD